MTFFESTTDEELIALYKTTADNMSYFNCGESMSWYAEKEQRHLCSVKLRKIKEEFVARGLDVPSGSWLI